MTIKTTFFILLLVGSATILFPWLNNQLVWYRSSGIEDALVRLGNPLAADGKTGRALNVWDLQTFSGKVYVAGGSTVENSGPINVWAYDPTKRRFEQEYTVQEEAIEHFRVFDNQLYIPASDPQEGDSHKFYRRDTNGKWQSFESEAIELAHVRDLIKLKTGEILLVGNNRDFKDLSKPATALTKDEGKSFQAAGLDAAPDSKFNWFFSVFAYQNKIYAPTSLLKDSVNQAGTIATFDLKKQRFELDPGLNNAEFIPQALLEQRWGKKGGRVIYRPWHPLEFKGSLVYPVRSYSYYDQNYKQAYMNSIGFYVKPAPGVTPLIVQFPDLKSVGEDTLVTDEELYVLANARLAPDQHIVYVYKTANPIEPDQWQEVFHFRSSNKARSFEYLNDTFYFGLGQDYGDPVQRSGDVLSFSWR